MKLEFWKVAGGGLYPANEMIADKMKRFKNNELYTIEIKLSRNGDFHRKVFQFFQFCFEHWVDDNQYTSESRQFDVFREHMTVLAGYYDEYYSIDGSVRIEAKSLSYANMSQEEFEDLYNALINVALVKIFKDVNDENTYNQLLSFF